MTATHPPEPTPPTLASRLAPRLGRGSILVLGDGATAGGLPGAERRELGAEGDGSTASLAPGDWATVVIDAGAAAVELLQRLLEPLRGALAADGRLLVVLATTAPDAVPEAVATLYEGGFCLLRESRVEGDAILLEARPAQHLVRRYRDGDEDAILDLFARSFAPGRGVSHWRWKYRDNPWGALAISCAVAPGGELVAHYAAYPVPMRGADGRRLLCHQVGDTMTDRRFRHVGRGPTSLLGRTARHFYARCCERRIDWNYGFNTGNIQRFSQLFVGARKVWDLELFRASAAELRLAHERRFRPYRAIRAAALDSAFDALFERSASSYGLLVERTARYLEWRYLRCPDLEYRLYRVDRGRRLVGWGVFRRDRDRLLLGDALLDPEHPEALSTLLRAACQEDRAAAGGGAATVEGWLGPHPHWWRELLAATGFAPAPEPNALGMVFVPFRECPERELASRYYLMMGDSDLF